MKLGLGEFGYLSDSIHMFYCLYKTQARSSISQYFAKLYWRSNVGASCNRMLKTCFEKFDRVVLIQDSCFILDNHLGTSQHFRDTSFSDTWHLINCRHPLIIQLDACFCSSRVYHGYVISNIAHSGGVCYEWYYSSSWRGDCDWPQSNPESIMCDDVEH